jgi:hypothetical protein
LNGTSAPAILLECHFCDNTGDCNLHEEHYDAICEAIAESITGHQVPDEEQPPIEEIPPIQPEENRLDIVATATGSFTVVFNGKDVIIGEPDCADKVLFTVSHQGNVGVTINGQDYHNVGSAPPAEPVAMHTEIFATMFGGKADNEYSAYGPYDSQGRGPYLNDTEFYCALPMRIGEQPRVKVWNRKTGRSEVGRLMDIGPWCTNDPYWTTGARPAAETSYVNKTPLPADSGTHAGEIAGNPAGIDLSPALFKALGMTDNGNVDWCFEEDAVA